MKLEQWDLVVQTERPADFESLARHDCDIKGYNKAQGLLPYFNMLVGPTYVGLVKHFWVRASIYDKHAAMLEEHEKVLIDLSLGGKTREELGLEPFVETEIRSSIMGVPVFINQSMIECVIRRKAEGEFEDGLDGNKKSTWNKTVAETMFGEKMKGTSGTMSKKKRVILKIQNDNLLPKGGGSDQPSLKHRMFFHFFI